MKAPIFRVLAACIEARANCIRSANTQWFDIWMGKIESINAPSGSGIDTGTFLNLDKSHSELLVLSSGYRHMNDQGVYDGWTRHIVRVRGSLTSPGFRMTISGSNRNDVKDYLFDVFQTWLQQEIEI